MAYVQMQFEQFHNAIRLGRFDENQTLREKRDIIRNILHEKLPGVFEKYGEVCPQFYFCDQGSYDMDTGNKPLDGDYDIDQGQYFLVGIDAYPDPVVLKERVFEALVGHTNDVRIRRSCVTVFYQRQNEPIYHVDVAVYSDGSQNPDGKARLAKGKQNSAVAYRVWEVSDPQGLAESMWEWFQGNDRAQFRRIVRYFKRWKAVNFPPDGNAAPLGIGLTVATYDHLQPTYTDVLAAKPDDLGALRPLVRALLNRFTLLWDEAAQQWARRLSITLPVEPWNDLFAKMTNKQMAVFEERLQTLLATLDAAAAAIDPVDACTKLREVFGDDFPVPTKAATARRHPPAIVSSSHSA
jgi:hypothetical protein